MGCPGCVLAVGAGAPIAFELLAQPDTKITGRIELIERPLHHIRCGVTIHRSQVIGPRLPIERVRGTVIPQLHITQLRVGNPALTLARPPVASTFTITGTVLHTTITATRHIQR